MDLLPQDRVLRIRRVRTKEDDDLLFEKVRLSVDVFPGLTASAITDISALAQKHGLVLGDAIERVSFGVISDASARALGVAAGTSMRQSDRVVHLRDGRPADWRTTYGLVRPT